MRMLKVLSVLVALAGVGVLFLVAAPSVHGPFDSRVLAQGRQRDAGPRTRALTVLAGRGAEIGVTIGDVMSAEKGPAPGGGVVVEDVQADSPAEKAGLKRADVIVEFDGEHVRSARQFTRLVQETAPGRRVQATIVRDGQRKDVQVTPTEGGAFGPWADTQIRPNAEAWLGDLGRLTERMPFDFNRGDFAFAMPQPGGGRLGLSVEELTPQLAAYFGAKEGVLVASITEDSPASRAGLKAGDVITTVNSEPVRSRADLLRLLRDVKDGGDAAIGIVRDKKESTVTAKIESRRPARRGQPA